MVDLCAKHNQAHDTKTAGSWARVQQPHARLSYREAHALQACEHTWARVHHSNHMHDSATGWRSQQLTAHAVLTTETVTVVHQ